MVLPGREQPRLGKHGLEWVRRRPIWRRRWRWWRRFSSLAFIEARWRKIANVGFGGMYMLYPGRKPMVLAARVATILGVVMLITSLAGCNKANNATAEKPVQ